MSIRESVKHFLRMCGHAASSTIHERLDVLDQELGGANLAETQAALLQAAIHSAERLDQLTNYTLVDTNGEPAQCPEAGLIDFLCSYIPSRKTLDLGAGDAVSQCLNANGYEVHVDHCAETAMAIASIDRSETLPREMKSRGFPWSLVVYRLPQSDRVGFYANASRVAPNGGGSIFFFRDYDLFAQALNWCSAVLVRTYFRSSS